MDDNYELVLYGNLCAKEGCKKDETIRRIIRNAVVTGELNFCGQLISQSSCRIISQIVKNSSNFHTANFSDCMLDPGGLEQIIDAITTHKMIKEFNLHGNNVKDENICKLGKLLTTNSSLKNLILKWNNMGLSTEHFPAFCNGLAKNESLEYLDLRSNNLSHNAISHLANALKNNTTLRQLDLRWNKIGSAGAEYLLEAMEVNRSLQNLQLKGNVIPREMTLAIEQCIKSNVSFGHLNMEYEKKVEALMRKIQALEETHAQHLEIIKEVAEKRISESDQRLSSLTNNISQKIKTIGELEEQIMVLKSNLNVEKQRADTLEQALNEREKTYKELLESHQSSVDAMKKALHEKDVEQIRMNTLANEKINKERKLLDKAEGELSSEKMRNASLSDEINWLKNKMESLVQRKTETLEVEKDMWRRKYDELETSSNAQLQRLKTLAIDKQQSLENTIMDLSDKQASQILTLTERYDRLKHEKTMTEEQLSSVQSAVITLQRENSALISQVVEPARKVASLLEELSNERMNSEKIKQQKLIDERTINELKNEIDKLHLDVTTSKQKDSDNIIRLEKEISKLKEKNMKIKRKLASKERKIAEIRNKEKERMKMLHSAVNKYLEPRLSSSPRSSEDS